MPVQDTADHRRSQRFSLRLAVKCLRTEPPVTLERASIGESVNVSSTGLLFTTTEALLPGQLAPRLGLCLTRSATTPGDKPWPLRAVTTPPDIA
jgi:hypothetical protein